VTALGAGDFNADGKGDFVVTGTDTAGQTNTASVKLLLGKGDATFQTPVPYYSCASTQGNTCSGSFPGNVGELMVANMTSTAHPDVGVSLLGLGNFSGNGYFAALKSLTTGALQPYGPWQIATPSSPSGMAAADFDSDNIVDVAQFEPGGNPRAHILIGDGNGNYGLLGDVLFASPASGFSLGAADFTRDGKNDLVVLDANGISVYPGKGDGTFKVGKSTGGGISGSSGLALAVGDLNLDGIPDVAASNWSGHSMVVGINKGDGTFYQSSYACGNMPFGIAIGDLNNDGRPDIVVADQSAIQVFINKTP
jgi:hypothetical protein